MVLEQKIEALLFYKNEPVEIKKLAAFLDVGEKEAREAIKNLDTALRGRGVCLVQTKDEVSLATAPEMKDLIEKIAKDEMSREIGKAGLETLSIILYKGPATRREVDYVRGVNSSFILRNLCMRGLIEKEADARDQRVLRYRASLPLLAHLGIKKVEELPEFDMFRGTVNTQQDEE